MAPDARLAPDLWSLRYASASAQALYLHVPFCRQKCRYCDFASYATDSRDPLMYRYVRALCHQMDRLGELGLLERCATVYVGGGTPSHVGPRITELFETAGRWCQATELTCEANPESLSPELARILRDAGTTRLSLGVQSLADEELAALGRIHTADKAQRAARAGLAAGLDVSIDLMCGIPLQTQESWHATLCGALELGVGHVSVYPLQLEEGTALERMVEEGQLSVADDDATAHLMEIAASELASAGLGRYEVASYAKAGADCAHNEAYWTGRPYIGLGSAAAGMLTREGYARLRDAAPQLPVLPGNIARVRMVVQTGREELVACDERRPGALDELHFDLEMLNERQALAEDLMLGARMAAGVAPALLDLAREGLGASAVDAAIERATREGLAVLAGDGSLAPTQDGWLCGNELYGLLWSLAGDDEVRSVSC